METITYKKVCRAENVNGRWYPAIDEWVSNADRGYARKATAVKHAESMARSCYRPFVDFMGRSVTFIFEIVG